jgi:hypothetical protein
MKLLQECDHNVQRAVDVVQEQGLPTGTRQWSEEECSEFEEGLQCIRTPLAPRVVNMLCVKTPQFAWPISRCIATVAILGSPAVTTQCCATSFPSVVAIGK